MSLVFQLLVGVAGAILCMCNIDWLLSGDLVDHWGALAMLGVVWLKCMREQAGPVPLVCFYTILVCLVWLGILYRFAFLPWAGPEAWRLGLRPGWLMVPFIPTGPPSGLAETAELCLSGGECLWEFITKTELLWNGFCDGKFIIHLFFYRAHFSEACLIAASNRA